MSSESLFKSPVTRKTHFRDYFFYGFLTLFFTICLTLFARLFVKSIEFFQAEYALSAYGVSFVTVAFATSLPELSLTVKAIK